VKRGVVAVVPLRSLTGGKTRLSEALSPESRAALTRRMFTHVIDAIVQSETTDAVIVVSPDPAALSLAGTLSSRVIPLFQPEGVRGLNPAIHYGIERAAAESAHTALVLFADLPFLMPDDLHHLLRRDAPVIIAPDRHGTGTNALALRLGSTVTGTDRFNVQFGEDSYARHVEEAHRLGLDVATSLTTGTAFDLDTADDLQQVLIGNAMIGSTDREFTRWLADNGRPLSIPIGETTR
jgi:2-phospho-L-lactate guanylyltransferase